MIEVIHITMYNPNTAQEEVLRVCSSEDFIANGHAYLPILTEGLDFDVSLYSKGTTEGDVSVGVGAFKISNVNGALDHLEFYGFDGRTIEVFKPRDKYDRTTDDTNVYFRGVVAYVEMDWDEITVYVKNRMEVLDIPLQPATFAGTNAGTGGAGGYEGSEDLAGETKPQVYGRVNSVEGAVVNQFFLMYAFNYDSAGAPLPLYAVYNVYVKGVRYVWNNTDHATPDLMKAATVAAGYYTTCLAYGMIRLGSIPADNGTVVADVADKADPECTVARCVQRVFERSGFVAGEDYDLEGLLQLDRVNTTPAGYYVTKDVTIGEVINAFLDSICAWFVPNSNGFFKFGYMDLADALVAVNPPVCTITEWKSISRNSTQDQSKNIPAYSATVKHTMNWTVQDSSSLADSVGIAAREDFTKEWRMAEARNDDILEAHPLAPALVYETLLNGPIYLPLRNGDFTVDITSVGNGWSVVNSPGINQQNGGVEISPKGGLNAKITQSLPYIDSAYPGYIEVIFTVPANSGPVLLDITRKLFGGVVLWSETIPLSTQDVTYVRKVYLPFNLALADGVFVIAFTTVNPTTSFKVQNVMARVPQQGGGPQSIANKRLELNSAHQSRFQLEVAQSFYVENGIDVGKMVILKHPKRFGLQDGKAFLVIGADPSAGDFTVALDVWRASSGA